MDRRAAAIIHKDNKILLMHRIKNGEEYYVFPGGGVETGESVGEAIRREVKEEFTLDIAEEKEVFVIENMGRTEHYYLITKFDGTPEIGGPEKERMNDQNFYEPYWAEVSSILGMENLHPEEARVKASELLQKKQID